MGQRTRGMTVFGLLSLGFGACYGAIALMTILRGAKGGGAQAMGIDGGLGMFVSIGTVAACLMMIVSSVGVLKVASWGRTLSMSAGLLGLIVFGTWLLMSGFKWFSMPGLGYSLTLTIMCFMPGWKSAFCGGGTSSMAAPASAPSGETKAAA